MVCVCYFVKSGYIGGKVSPSLNYKKIEEKSIDCLKEGVC